MPKQNCFAVRPGSILVAWETTWKVLENNTLEQYLILGEVDHLTHRKRVRYSSGQTLFLRWEPHDRL